MKYLIYKITNVINRKIYIGCHKTSDLDDGYMGSGVHLKRAQEKYGIENFEKEILEVFDNPEAMFEMEAKLVNSDFVERTDTYNLKEGGNGGFDFINKNGINNLSNQFKTAGNAHKKSRIENPEKFVEINKAAGKRLKEMHQKGLIKYDTFTGKTHSKESKKKISEARKGKVSGKDNPSFGTMWIHNLDLTESKKINKDDLSIWEAKGWLKGRKMKF